jgi:hypothetical protein
VNDTDMKSPTPLSIMVGTSDACAFALLAHHRQRADLAALDPRNPFHLHPERAHERRGQNCHSKHHQIESFDQSVAAYLFENIAIGAGAKRSQSVIQLASITKHDNSCARVLLLETSLFQMPRSDSPMGEASGCFAHPGQRL